MIFFTNFATKYLNIIVMKKSNIIMWIATLLLTAVAGTTQSYAQLLKGRERVTTVSELKEGHVYFLVSDRKKFVGNTTGLPKAMSTLQESYPVKWGDKYVYWGDIDTTKTDYKWKAERCGEGWAFLNMGNNRYLGPKNTDEADVIFSDTPMQYDLIDLEEGAGRFYMIGDGYDYSLTVQGFGISRADNALAVQREGNDEYDSQAATNGYPGRWRIFSAEAYDASQDDGSYDDPVVDPDPGPSPEPTNLLEDYKRIFNISELEDGATYFIISDRTKYAGNSTGKPKAMSPMIDSYTINWGDQYVYWGDFDEEQEAFQWIAEETTDGRWAFRNVTKNLYLGEGSGGDQDVIFSSEPVGYTLTDLEEGAGRFYMVSDDNTHSPHVQGYLRSDRPNNSLGKQTVGDDDYSDDVADNGYPGRWQLYLCKSNVKLGYIDDLSEVKEGATYWIISDRKKWAGSSVETPRAMSTLQSSYSVNWGDKFVYWGALNEEADGYVWEAEKVGDTQWAFKNKENSKYLGTKNPGETDMVFSETPVGFTLTDLGETFTFTNSEYTTPLNTIGYSNVNRPNNTVGAKQDDSDANCTDGAANGYPGQWRLYKLSEPAEPTQKVEIPNGFYNIVSTTTPKLAWLQSQEDEVCAATEGAELMCKEMRKGDPRTIFYIQKMDEEKGTYSMRNYVTNQYVGQLKDGVATMTDTETPLTLEYVPDVRNTLYIYSNDEELPLCAQTSDNAHIGTDANWQDNSVRAQWKVQSVTIASMRTNAAKIRYNLAKEVAASNNPTYFKEYTDLSEDKQEVLKRVWNKAQDHLYNGAFQIIVEQDIDNLKAALKGEYEEPVYNKYQKDTLTVVSYNVKRCNGNYRQTAKVIMNQKPDVVAIQEVDSTSTRFQMAQLAQATGMYGIFCHADTPDYGIGMLCSEKPLSVKCVDLVPDFERRVMLVCEFQNYVFCSLHVGIYASSRRGDTGSGGMIYREAQKWEASGKPFIVAGDFNDDGTDGEMQGARGALTKYLQEHDFTYHSDLKTPTWSEGIYVIDNIISYDKIGGVEKIDYYVVDDHTTSDHMPIVANLLVGFEDPNGIKFESAKVRKCESEKVYDLNGTQVAESADGIASLPGGIYIFDGKKMKK